VRLVEGPAWEPRPRKSRPGAWTDDRVLAALRDWFELFGESPLAHEWVPGGAEWMRRYPRWPSTATVVRHFGTWSAAVRAAGLPPARPIAPRRGLEERIAAAKRLSAQGHATGAIAALLEVAPRTVRGYLRAAPCRDCGTFVVTSTRCAHCAGRRPEWTREEVLAAFRAWVREEGRVPAAGDWVPTADATRKWGREYPRWPSDVTVRTLFGSWRAGVAAAGLRPRRRRWSADAVVAALRDFEAQHGRPPTYADLGRSEDLPAPGTVRAHLGSLRAALAAAARPAGGVSRAATARARRRAAPAARTSS
jgi:DNA-binding CsgD family transcriptional regulator